MSRPDVLIVGVPFDSGVSSGLQCVPASTPESLLREALGRLGVQAQLKRTGLTGFR